MTERDYQIIVTACEEGSFFNAAKKLYISQPAYSQAIKKIENEIGASLFTRLGNRVVPTPICKNIAEAARPILRELRILDSNIGNIVNMSSIDVTVAASALTAKSLLFPAKKKMLEERPDVTVKIYENTADNLVSALIKGLAGIVVTSRVYDNPTVTGEVLFKGETLLAVPNAHPFARKHPFKSLADLETVSMKELKDEPFTLPVKHNALRNHQMQFFEEVDVKPNIFHETTVAGNVKDFVRAGDSLALVSLLDTFMFPDTEQISYYRIDSKFAKTTYYTYHLSENILSDADKLFIKKIKELHDERYNKIS